MTNTSKSISVTCSHCKAHLQLLYHVSRMSAAERLRLLVLLHGLCWIGSLCLTTLLPGYMNRICGQIWPADCRLQRFQPFSIETSCPLTALQHMQLRLLLRKGSLRLSTLWPRLNNALQNLTPAFWNCLILELPCWAGRGTGSCRILSCSQDFPLHYVTKYKLTHI